MKILSFGKYSTENLTEGQFEEGSAECIYENLLGVKDAKQMDEIETEYSLEAFKHFIGFFSTTHKFLAKDIQFIHKTWLDKVYTWAGQYRQVNISKGGFVFAAAKQVPKLMIEFEKKVLVQYTPCNSSGCVF